MRIAIVNDAAMAIAALRRVVSAMPEHVVLWTARDGAEAVARCAAEPPDLVLMDLFMPVMDGVEATRRIMATSPCAVLVVTATVEGNRAKVYEALGAGAVDAVATPVLGTNGAGEGALALRDKIAMIGVLAKTAGRPSGDARPVAREPAPPRSRVPLVAIGASAGGPAALATLLGSLPAGFPAPVLIVQHVDAQFAPGMAEWLGTQSAIPVHVAHDGDRPEPGVALLAGTDDHLTMTAGGRLRYVREPVATSYRPSVDVLFRSLLGHWHGPVIAVLLTGMGRDGAAGLKVLRDAGARTFAQDRATSTVYGMPKAAADLGAADEVLPLAAIGPRLAEIVTGGVLPSLRLRADP